MILSEPWGQWKGFPGGLAKAITRENVTQKSSIEELDVGQNAESLIWGTKGSGDQENPAGRSSASRDFLVGAP
jgi:hypothetical protein